MMSWSFQSFENVSFQFTYFLIRIENWEISKCNVVSLLYDSDFMKYLEFFKILKKSFSVRPPH